MRLCSRCKKNPAVIFVSRIEGDKTTQEGLCIKCAMELNIGPIKDMLSKMGITDEDIDALNENFTESLGISLSASLAGTSPEAIRKASPSAIAVLPTPGSPIRHG